MVLRVLIGICSSNLKKAVGPDDKQQRYRLDMIKLYVSFYTNCADYGLFDKAVTKPLRSTCNTVDSQTIRRQRRFLNEFAMRKLYMQVTITARWTINIT